MHKRLLIVFAGLIALAGLVAACGDDDGGGDSQTSEIRTQKGLSVAAVAAELGFTGGVGGDATDTDDRAQSGGVAAPQADTTVAKDIGVTRESAPYFAFQEGGNGISVLGYGSASADPDSAIVEFSFGRNGEPVPLPAPDGSIEPGTSGSSGADIAPQESPIYSGDLPEVAAITEADLQPVIDALVTAGVAREDIEFIAQGYYDPYFASATLRATINDVAAVDGAVQAAQDNAAGLEGITLQSTNVSYTLQDCNALERAAMQAAVEDAGDRATVLAEVLGVGLGAVTGASNYSYAPYGGTPCGGDYYGPYPLGGVAYAEGGTRTVEVFAQIGVTYAIQ